MRYKGIDLDSHYRMDVVVDGCLIIDVKAVEQIAPVHEAQLLTYLRFSGTRLGLLLNFNAAALKDGIGRRRI